MDPKKANQQIMAVKRSILFDEKFFTGFCPKSEYDFYKLITNNYSFYRRGDIESDESLQQPIPYCIVCNPDKSKVLVYKRNPNFSGEARLHNNLSIGVGGHIEDIDVDKDSSDPILCATLREIKEEIGIDANSCIEFKGLLNDETSPVERVHVGLIFVVCVDENLIRNDDPELMDISFVSWDELFKLHEDKSVSFDTWSTILYRNKSLFL